MKPPNSIELLGRPKKFYQDLSIRVWLFLLVLIFALPAGVGMAWYAVAQRQAVRQEAYKSVEMVAFNVALNLDVLLHDYERLLKLLASDQPSWSAPPAKKFNPVTVLQSDPLVRSLCLRGLDATVIYASVPNPVPAREVLPLPWAQNAIHSDVWAISGALQDQHSGRWVVKMTYPLRNPSGQRTGFIDLSLDLLRLNERTLGRIPAGIMVPVFDRSDRFLLRSANPQALIGQPLPPQLADDVRGKTNGYLTNRDLSGVSRFYAVASVPSAGWRVFAGMPEAEVLAPARQQFALMAGVGAAVLLVLVALAWKMSQAIAQPVRDLANTARKAVFGQDNTRAVVSGPAEVAEVAREFNQMLDTRTQAERKLLEQEFLLSEAQRVGQIGSYVMDLVADRWTSSDVLDQIFGLEPHSQRSTASWSALVHPDDRADMLDYYLHEVLALRHNFDREYRVVRPSDGATRWVWGHGELRFGEDGTPVKMIGTIQDVTERKRAELALSHSADQFRHLIDHLEVGVVVHAPDTSVRLSNHKAAKLLGLSLAQMQGKAAIDPAWHFVHEDGSRLLPQAYPVAQVQASQSALANLTMGIHQAQGAAVVWVQVNAYPEFDEQAVLQHIVVTFADITTIKEHQKQLEQIAHYDALTGLPNRLLLSDRLRQAIAQSQRRGQALAVVYLDLDNIKAVNDTHGHNAGDVVLKVVCERMKEVLREGDTLARMGGDEFVAVLVDINQPQACLPVIERLLQAAARPVLLPASTELDASQPERSVQVSASIGLTFYPQDDVDAEVLLRHADQAMYLAKQTGKNRYHLFDIANDVAIHSRHEELKRISAALSQGELLLYYQPKVNMRSGAVIGAEALTRWQHPERGLLPPGAFLPAIENHLLSIAVGEWVINTAMTQMATWHAQGLDLVVSVNIGALQLQQDDFPERLRAVLAAHPDVTPNHLQLEILETSALQDIAKVSAVMRACRAMGVAFALDDFGTGYSSLTYLKHLPAEILKIDQSFVRNMTEQPDDLAIVKGVIGLASVFQRQVIAEGVESKALGDLLLGIGCDLVQGYGVARPMPAQDLPAWVVQWQQQGWAV